MDHGSLGEERPPQFALLQASPQRRWVSGEELVRHMVDYEVGVQPKGSFTVYRLDEDFFDKAD